MNDNTRTDEQGIRYFCDRNGSRVNYPASTRFGDGYQQPAIEGVTVWKSAGAWPDDNTTPTPHTLSNFRVEYVKPDYSRGHSFEPRCAILANDAALGGVEVRVFDVPDPDESQRAVAQFACDAMNDAGKYGRLLQAAKALVAMNNCNYDRAVMRSEGGFDALDEAITEIDGQWIRATD